MHRTAVVPTQQIALAVQSGGAQFAMGATDGTVRLYAVIDDTCRVLSARCACVVLECSDTFDVVFVSFVCVACDVEMVVRAGAYVRMRMRVH